MIKHLLVNRYKNKNQINRDPATFKLNCIYYTCMKCNLRVSAYKRRINGLDIIKGKTNYNYNMLFQMYSCNISDKDHKMRELLK